MRPEHAISCFVGRCSIQLDYEGWETIFDHSGFLNYVPARVIAKNVCIPAGVGELYVTMPQGDPTPTLRVYTRLMVTPMHEQIIDTQDALGDLLAALAELRVSIQRVKADLGAGRQLDDDLAHGVSVIEEELDFHAPRIFQAIEERSPRKFCSATRALVASAIVFEGARVNKLNNPQSLNQLLDSLGRIAIARAQLCQPHGLLDRSSLAATQLKSRTVTRADPEHLS